MRQCPQCHSERIRRSKRRGLLERYFVDDDRAEDISLRRLPSPLLSLTCEISTSRADTCQDFNGSRLVDFHFGSPSQFRLVVGAATARRFANYKWRSCLELIHRTSM